MNKKETKDETTTEQVKGHTLFAIPNPYNIYYPVKTKGSKNNNPEKGDKNSRRRSL